MKFVIGISRIYLMNSLKRDLKEKCIFFNALGTLNLFKIISGQADFLLNESNWKTDKFKEKFNTKIRTENP